LDNDDFLLLDYLGFHLLLLVGLQGALVLRLLAHPLDRTHHVGLLGQKRIAQLGGPLNVVAQTFDQIR